MINKEQYLYIKNNPAFLHFSVEEFDEIAANIVFRTVPKGQILFFDDEERENLYLIHKGFVRIEKFDKDFNFNYIDYIKENSLFPIGGIFSDNYYHYSGIAISKLEYFKIPVSLYEKFSLGNDEQLKFIINQLSIILEFQELRLMNLTLSSARNRVISVLSTLQYDFCSYSNKIPFPISLIEIAKISCTSRETAAHVIKELSNNSIIEYRNKYIKFIDLKKLSNYTIKD